MSGNGATGGGNIVTVEMMIPRAVGVEHTYAIQVSIDGKGGFDSISAPHNPYDNAPADTFNTDIVAYMTVLSGSLDGATLDETTTIRTVSVKYVDENGKEIAKTEQYRGYGVTMLNEFGIHAKEIEGYELVQSPDPDLLEGSVKAGFIRELKSSDYTLTYKYKNLNPDKPDVKDTVKLAKVTLKQSVYDYTGKSITPKFTVTDSKKKTVSSSMYKVSGASSSVGKHTLTISGRNGAEGSVKATYTIRPSKVSGLKGTSGKKKAVLSWKSHKTQTTGFQVQYSTSKTFKGAKTTTVKSASAKKITLKGLKSKKKYYVRVRAYKKVSKASYYSAWSSAKSVKVK